MIACGSWHGASRAECQAMRIVTYPWTGFASYNCVSSSIRLLLQLDQEKGDLLFGGFLAGGETERERFVPKVEFIWKYLKSILGGFEALDYWKSYEIETPEDYQRLLLEIKSTGSAIIDATYSSLVIPPLSTLGMGSEETHSFVASVVNDQVFIMDPTLLRGDRIFSQRLDSEAEEGFLRPVTVQKFNFQAFNDLRRTLAPAETAGLKQALGRSSCVAIREKLQAAKSETGQDNAAQSAVRADEILGIIRAQLLALSDVSFWGGRFAEHLPQLIGPLITELNRYRSASLRHQALCNAGLEILYPGEALINCASHLNEKLLSELI